MHETGMHDHSSADRPNRGTNRAWSIRRARKRRRQRNAATIVILCVCAFGILFALRPASASSATLLRQLFSMPAKAADAAPSSAVAQPDSVVQFHNVAPAPAAEDAIVDFGSLERLAILSWQGAKNCGDSFPVTLDGGSGSGSVRFEVTNCSVFPFSGDASDTYTVTITGAGAYSLTAVVSEAASSELRDTKVGVAGKANQMPLSIAGWGGAKDYYHTFDIRVLGGTTGGEISFIADGCTVSPEKGTAATTFTVTVTRVGSYELTAVMQGDSNYGSAYSARQSGCADKSKQASMHIEDWISDASCGDTFPVTIYGGSTREALVLEPLGCEVTQLSSDTYEVCVTAVGPYAVTATRAGNYGYHEASASVSGVAEKALAPSLSVSGWAESKNCNDSFPIHVNGGVSGGTIHFAASGCTVSPAGGTTETSYTVTVTAAGPYSLSASMEAGESHEGAVSRNYHGEAGKGIQGALRADNWNASAPAGSSFEFAVGGGSGSGALCLTTNDGCVARLKSGETNIYVVTVHARAGMDYAINVCKAGDATYTDAEPQTFSGKTARGIQAALSVSGWNESASAGEPFTIGVSGGSGTGAVSFDVEGCKVAAAQDGAFAVTVTALEGKPYSLTIKRAGDDNYAATSAVLSGSTQVASALTPEQAAAIGASAPESVTPLNSIWVYAVLLMILGVALLVLQWSRARKTR